MTMPPSLSPEKQAFSRFFQPQKRARIEKAVAEQPAEKENEELKNDDPTTPAGCECAVYTGDNRDDATRQRDRNVVSIPAEYDATKVDGVTEAQEMKGGLDSASLTVAESTGSVKAETGTADGAHSTLATASMETKRCTFPSVESELSQSPDTLSGEESTVKNNPFAQFAFSTDVGERAKSSVTGSSVNWVARPNTITGVSGVKGLSDKTRIKHGQTKSKKTKKDFVRMKDCSQDECVRIVTKWHTLADPKAPLEVRRFQVLVAARLHARCQDTVVRQTMTSLRQTLVAEGFTVETMSRLDSELLAPTLSSLQYYNTKAQHVVAASKEVISNYDGIVPESETELLKITGIGPVMADLLSYVNTRDRHNDTSGLLERTTVDGGL